MGLFRNLIFALAAVFLAIPASAEETPVLSVELNNAKSIQGEGCGKGCRVCNRWPGRFAAFSTVKNQFFNFQSQPINNNGVTLALGLRTETLPDSEQGIAGLGMDTS